MRGVCFTEFPISVTCLRNIQWQSATARRFRSILWFWEYSDGPFVWAFQAIPQLTSLHCICKLILVLALLSVVGGLSNERFRMRLIQVVSTLCRFSKSYRLDFSLDFLSKFYGSFPWGGWANRFVYRHTKYVYLISPLTDEYYKPIISNQNHY